MATAPTTIVLNTGKVFLSQLLIEGITSQVGQARIGSTAGFIPLETGTVPTPSTVATIAATDIDVNFVNGNEARFTVNFNDTIGGFSIGNIMLDLEYNGVMHPFAWFALDDAIPKTAASDTDVGNSFAISFTVEWLNIADAISIIVETPTYASLPSYANETVLPPAAQSLYQQLTIQQYTALRTPALIMRRSADNTFFGFPFLQRMDDPFFGRFLGGNSGDRYLPYSGFTYWGGLFITDASEYNTTIGGEAFTNQIYTSTITADPFTYVEPA